ncbi:MAG: RpiB/LacA/LacB family sugar-phosphate isomerase [candidate division Zixibacteria bacterium]|nr:RpiB/LacA/LacB family sugar-phosphate isomerase [candidate division Zixibacteria bacterium]
MKVSIAADNRGLGHKSKVKVLLERLGHEVIDHGAHTKESVDYPDFGALVAEDVAEGKVDTGIAICMTGNGMNMTVNRFPGIRGALVLSAEMARLARAHNDRETRVFKDIIYQVDLTGSLSEADVETLARQASDRCFVENTLSKVIPITTEVHLNGKKVLSFTRKP